MEERELTGDVEVFKVATFEIKAKCKPDAEQVLGKLLRAEDEIVETRSERNIYTARVRIFVGRDGPT